MEKRDLVSGIFLTLLGLSICITAYKLGLGTGSEPGAGFAAFGIAAILCLLSVLMLIGAFIRVSQKGKKKEDNTQKIMWKKPLLILVILGAYGFLFNFLGFPLSTFFLMVFLVWVFGRRKLLAALIVSLLTVALSYTLFVIALGLPLPMGSIWYFFGA